MILHDRSLTIEDRSGEMNVFLDPISDDHIVTIYIDGRDGRQFETTLPSGSLAWDRAVERAYRAAVFL